MAKLNSAPAGVHAEGEFPVSLTDYFFHMVFVVSRNQDARIEAMVRPLGIDLAQGRALVVIDRLGTCTMGELADYCVTDRTTMTRIVDHLVDAALVERAKAKEDRRQVLLTLTPAGRDLFVRGMGRVQTEFREVLAGFSESELRKVTQLLIDLAGRLVSDPVLLERFLWTRDERSVRPAAPADSQSE